MGDRLPRKLAAILYADVANYSRLTDEDEEGTHRRLSTYLDAFTAAIERYDGRVVHFAGDAILAEFSSVSQALTCAVMVQQVFDARNGELPEGRKVQFRIGVNLGEVIVDRNDIYGDGVNVAARLEGVADPGGICISEAAHSAVRKQLNLNFVDMGEQAVKNISEPIRVHKVVMGEEASLAESPKSPSLKFPDKPSIAVLPFVNMSMDSDQEYLADGITEDILTGLSRARWLVVASRNSSFAYKGKNTDVKRIAKELGVRYILEGSVRIAGSHTRITGQLIDASTDRYIWAERYDRELEDISNLQDEITGTILGTIEPELGLAEQERARRKAPDSLDAWDLYLRGQWHLYRFRPADNAEAQQFFRQAIEVDPNFAASPTGLAYAGRFSITRRATSVSAWGPASRYWEATRGSATNRRSNRRLSRRNTCLVGLQSIREARSPQNSV